MNVDKIEGDRIKTQKKRIIGLDYGMARIGIAFSDETQTIASSLTTLKTDKKAEKTMLNLVEQLDQHQVLYQYAIEEIVIGLPLMMNGKIGLLADEVKYFAELIKNHTLLPVILWDERLTSVQADRSMREGSLTRKRRAQNADSVAALIILQSYLDHQKLKKANF